MRIRLLGALPMKSFLKKIIVFSFVIVLSWIGIEVGQLLSRQLPEFYLVKRGAAIASMSHGQQDRYENLELFNRVMHFVEANYVDEVKNKDLVQGAIKGMLEILDPHSNFLPADLYKDMQIDTSGKFGGLGIEIGMKDNILTILAPIEDTPAWKAGLKPNDRIVKINSESTKGMSLVKAVSLMRGKPRTTVVLGIYRNGFDRIKDITITRDVIKIQSVKNELLEPDFGYVRLTTFNENAASDMKKAIDLMSKKTKLKGLILDLRMNPGGLLDQAVKVSSLFIEEGAIVSTIGRNRDQKDVKYAEKGQAYKELPLAVLVNSSSASASEIVAGALQDHHRAIIMGQPTFGKGSVQTVIPLPPDMGLKLTIARYYTPSGRSIQEKGVHPDILLDDYDPKLLAQAKWKFDPIREKDLKGHMANDDTLSESDKGKEPKEDYKREELDALSDGKKKGDSSKDRAGKDTKEKEEDDMTPYRMNPKEDFQVKQALIALKAFEVFQKKAN